MISCTAVLLLSFMIMVFMIFWNEGLAPDDLLGNNSELNDPEHATQTNMN